MTAVSLLVGAASDNQAGQNAPRFSLRTLEGRSLRTEDLKDSVVLLDLWATWCEPCIGEIPMLNKIQEKYASRGVKVIGVAVQSGWPADVRKFAARHKMRYTILVGNDDVVSDFGVITFPTTYLIAPGWKIHKKYSGTYDKKGAELESDIELLLQAKTRE